MAMTQAVGDTAPADHTCALVGDMAIFTACAKPSYRLRIIDYRHAHYNLYIYTYIYIYNTKATSFYAR